MPEVLNFAATIVLKGFKGISVKFGQWEWHLPLLGDIVYHRNCYNIFQPYLLNDKILYLYPYVTILTWEKTILNFICLFHLTAYKWNTSDAIEIKLYIDSTFMPSHFWKWSKSEFSFQAPCTHCMDLSAKAWLYTKNICEYVKYLNKIQEVSFL